MGERHPTHKPTDRHRVQAVDWWTRRLIEPNPFESIDRCRAHGACINPKSNHHLIAPSFLLRRTHTFDRKARSIMVKARMLTPLPFWDEDSVLAFLEERGWKACHAYSLWKLCLRHRPAQLSELAAAAAEERVLLPGGLVEALCERFTLTTSTVVEKHVSEDGTTKLLVELQDGQRVEAVVIRHQGRNTLCVSSQVGCQMACTFCATGTMGIKGNLMGGEILEQLYHANGVAKIRNVVFMGGWVRACVRFEGVSEEPASQPDIHRLTPAPHHTTGLTKKSPPSLHAYKQAWASPCKTTPRSSRPCAAWWTCGASR